ncbi:uncharacterized protein BCR38DRAFT_175099 [Pseudomassariella vexata]|uniref:Uncharacterized protein n=1 Tax=Pseudomassariella vexata TaxID=1141098 RepID=A0A1Y2E5Q9_9PEZI|nr:uncharacterized protein BCR38DRAFT_175099 [Pseudomassariella vexata]ORY66205.1 hypothetical protein BCR38DRAFT_175099 [Pseudomassariella vexata]
MDEVTKLIFNSVIAYAFESGREFEDYDEFEAYLRTQPAISHDAIDKNCKAIMSIYMKHMNARNRAKKGSTACSAGAVNGDPMVRGGNPTPPASTSNPGDQGPEQESDLPPGPSQDDMDMFPEFDDAEEVDYILVSTAENSQEVFGAMHCKGESSYIDQDSFERTRAKVGKNGKAKLTWFYKNKPGYDGKRRQTWFIILSNNTMEVNIALGTRCLSDNESDDEVAAASQSDSQDARPLDLELEIDHRINRARTSNSGRMSNMSRL